MKINIIQSINDQIDSGKTIIVVSKETLMLASDEEIEEAKRLCKLNECKIKIE